MSDILDELVGLRTDVRQEIGAEIVALRADVGGLRTEISPLRTEISGFRTDMSEDIGRLEIGIAGLPEGIRQEFGALLTKIGDQIGDVRTDIGFLHTLMHEDNANIDNILEELRGLRADMRQEIGSLRMETHDNLQRLLERQARQNRQLYWVVAGIFVLIATAAEGFHLL